MVVARFPVTLEVDLQGYASTQKLVILTCHNCSSPVCMTEDHYRRAQEDKSVNFYCSRGHPAIFTKTRVMVLEGELAEAQERANREATRRQESEKLLALREAADKRLRRRIAAGICPHCHRTFQSLARHMETQHKVKA